MKILFVDHVDHSRTGSSRFFIELLRGFFDLEILFVNPDGPTSIDVKVAPDIDLVVVWQADVLAPIFLVQGVRTVVVPMYDGSAGLPDLHWIWSRQARFINFSRRLHSRISYLGQQSLLVKYFKPPVAEDKRADLSDGLRIFLWQRRPEQGINLHMVERLMGAQMRSVHIHDVADNKQLDTAPYLRPSRHDYVLTTSRWFENPGDYIEVLDRCNVFITPRLTEGIAMTVLEALSRGMLILAADAPVHDEYISNWVNGVLFNPEAIAEGNFSDVALLGRLAWRTAQDGYENWLRTEPRIIDFIKSTPAPKPVPGIDIGAMTRGLLRAYGGGHDAYRGYLVTHMQEIMRMSGSELPGHITSTGEYVPAGPSFAETVVLHNRPWLENNRLDADTAMKGRHNVVGGFQLHDGSFWVVGYGAVLGFALDPSLGEVGELRLQYRLPPSQTEAVKLCITMNGVTLWMGELPDREGTLTAQIPAEGLKVSNMLQLQSDKLAFGCGLRPVSIGLKHLEFV
jgi:hypothetical protein